MLKSLAFLAVAITAPIISAQAAKHVVGVPPVPVVEVKPDYVVVWDRSPRPHSHKFADEIHEYSARFGVDPKLVTSVIRAESNFNPRAVSPKGAQGLMQLMPKTAQKLGVRDSFDPRENIRGGVQHLSYLLERYNGNTTLAVAAYNAGEGAVDTYRGVPPYDETRNYVRVVLAGLN